MTHVAADTRYDRMVYNRCGRSGLKLPAVSLGLWQNFGTERPLETSRAIVRRAFDLGITHFDLANNYGPPYGSAEENFGRLLQKDLAPFRDELVISTKAGYDMWPGPYGEWGSRKYLLASLDRSLGRMGLDSVDIFYSHHRGGACEDLRAERDRRPPWPDAGADGGRLGAPRRADHLGARLRSSVDSAEDVNDFRSSRARAGTGTSSDSS